MSRRSWVLLSAVTVFSLIYNAFLPLHPDEAYYWTWSNRLALSYFDHPPLVAYIIKATTLVGRSEFFVRLGSVVCLTLAALAVYHLARKLFDERTAEISMLIMLFLPITQAGFSVITPDAPLTLFWALTLLCLGVAIYDNKMHYMYLAGVCAGLLLLSKYNGVLLFPAVLVFLAASRHRGLLLRKETWAAVVIALVIFSPVVVWNAQHDWVSFRFQLNHGMGGGKALGLEGLWTYLGGQALAANPIFLIAMLVFGPGYIKANIRDDRKAFLFWPFIVPLVFFLAMGFLSKSEANWTAAAYISGSVMLAKWLTDVDRRWVYYAGVGLTLLMVALVKFPEAFPFLPEQVVVKQQFMGYKEIFRHGRIYTEDSRVVVVSDSYQLASEAWYYLGNQPRTYALSPQRPSEYDIWQGGTARVPAKDAVFFGSEQSLQALKRRYASVKLIDILRYGNRYTSRVIRVYRCSVRPLPEETPR